MVVAARDSSEFIGAPGHSYVRTATRFRRSAAAKISLGYWHQQKESSKWIMVTLENAGCLCSVIEEYGSVHLKFFPLATLYHAQPTGLFIRIIAQTLLPICERASLHIPDHSRVWMRQRIKSAQETTDAFFSKSRA